jgi:hypothetical protein
MINQKVYLRFLATQKQLQEEENGCSSSLTQKKKKNEQESAKIKPSP